MLTDLLTSVVSELLADIIGQDLRQIHEEQEIRRAVQRAIHRTETRFMDEYRAHDADLVAALTAHPRFVQQPAIHAALRDLVMRPFHPTTAEITTLQRSFDAVLPHYSDRPRVNAAVATFVQILSQEVLSIPQLQPRYSLLFQRATAISNQDIAAHTAALVQGMQELRTEVRHLPTGDGSALPDAAGYPAARPRPWQNLPRRTYTRFVGRQEELQKLTRLMQPYPRSRHFAVTLDGIGGVGKSALALEFAHRQREQYVSISPDERFAAIVWVTAKRTLLTAGGIQQRQQTFSTLADLYREIAQVLDVPAILQADVAQQRDLVEQALQTQRTLLIIDNLETVDDEELLTFLRELPDPTKVIVTTRHRIDIAYAIRVLGMPEADAIAFMVSEAANKNVELPLAATAALFRRTGGIPLAIVWSIGLLSLGHDINAVLRRLGSGHSDIARFCFTESVAHIRGHDAERLLLALALFEHSVNRVMLGEIAGLGDDHIGRDDGLAQLLQLSLVNKEDNRFSLLPLTRTFALEELKRQPELEKELRERWIKVLVRLAQPYNDVIWRRPDRRLLVSEGMHLITLYTWAEQEARPDVLLPIISALSNYYDLHGQWNDMLVLQTTGLSLAELVGDKQAVLVIKSKIAWIISQQGKVEEAVAVLADARTIAGELGDPLWLCEILIGCSVVSRRRGTIDQAHMYCQQAIALVPSLSEEQQMLQRADIEYELGKIARDRADWITAQKHFLAAQEVFRVDDEDNAPTFNLERAWGTLGQLAFINQHLGNVTAAAQMYQRALTLCQNTVSKGFITTLLVRLASLEVERGNTTAARNYACEALEWSNRLGIIQERKQAEAILAWLDATREQP